MDRYSALLEQFKQGKTQLEETWVICPKCLDAWLGRAGDKCLTCGQMSHQTPLFVIQPDVERERCDVCRFALSHVGMMIDSYKVCTTCVQVAENTWPWPIKPYISHEKAEFGIRRLKTISSLRV